MRGGQLSDIVAIVPASDYCFLEICKADGQLLTPNLMIQGDFFLCQRSENGKK